MLHTSIRLLTFLIAFNGPVSGETNKTERKLRDLLLLSKDIEIASAEFIAAKRGFKEGWQDYVYFSFEADSPFEAIIKSSRVMEGARISPRTLPDEFSSIPLKPPIPQDIADKERPSIVVGWYRQPKPLPREAADGTAYRWCGFAYMWCLAEKTEENRVKVMGFVRLGYLHTTGVSEKKMFDREGNQKPSEELFRSPTPVGKKRAEQ
jgi:hypothetical protein